MAHNYFRTLKNKTELPDGGFLTLAQHCPPDKEPTFLVRYWRPSAHRGRRVLRQAFASREAAERYFSEVLKEGCWLASGTRGARPAEELDEIARAILASPDRRYDGELSLGLLGAIDRLSSRSRDEFRLAKRDRLVAIVPVSLHEIPEDPRVRGRWAEDIIAAVAAAPSRPEREGTAPPTDACVRRRIQDARRILNRLNEYNGPQFLDRGTSKSVA